MRTLGSGENIGRTEALGRTSKALLKNLGRIVSGKVVMVPISRELYSQRIVRPDLGSDRQTVETALMRAPLTLVDRMDMEAQYDLAPGEGAWEHSPNLFAVNRRSHPE